MHNTRSSHHLILLFCLLLNTIAPGRVEAADILTITHRLSQSTTSFALWTAPPSRRIFKDDPLPEESGDAIRLSAAANEFEPFQLVVRPLNTTNVSIAMGDFGSGITTQLYQVRYVDIPQASDSLGRTGPYPDPLQPVENGASVSLAAGANTAIWVVVQVPQGTPAGDFSAQFTLGTIVIPIQLHVFNFTLPETPRIKSQMNFSHSEVLTKYGVQGTGEDYWSYVEMMKQFFIDHRLTPKSALWSGGLTSNGGASYIDYDCTTGTLTDPHGIWGFEQPAARYLYGYGTMSSIFQQPFNNGGGFPSFMAITFINNDASADQRPTSFCNTVRTSGDWYVANNPDTTYNRKWFDYMADTEEYLDSLGYLDKAYYYFANEPQDQADYEAVAWYSRHLKDAAPHLKLMVSEEPKEEIYNHPDYIRDHQIDIWLPVLHHYDPAISHEREANHGEESWVYFLHGTRPPYFNPITLDHPGIESKLTGWFLWKYRLRGIAYYSMNNWSKNPWTEPMTDNHNGDLFMLYPPSENNVPIAYGANNHRLVPSIRLELMRDSLEDYEYLFQLGGNQQPVVGQTNPADTQADKIIGSLTGYSRDDDFLYNLRRYIGLKIGGEIAEIPDISPPPLHPRAQGLPGSYHINFQDPQGQPTAEPLVVNGHEYMKIGWNTYNQDLGYGWYGDMAHVMYHYLSSGPNELQKSIIYDDWGRQKTFEFDLPNGTYLVTVSAGWQGRVYQHNFVSVEGVTFIDDEATAPYIVRTLPVTIADHKLTLAMGIFDEYTMLNSLDIVAAAPTTDFTATPLSGYAPLEVTFTAQVTNSPDTLAWDFNDDGTIDSSAYSPSHTYQAAGSHGVSLIASNTYGSHTTTKEKYIRVYQRGDLDCNDRLDLRDSLLLLQLAAGMPVAPGSGCPQLTADIDGNGQLGLGDAIAVLRQLAGGE